MMNSATTLTFPIVGAYYHKPAQSILSVLALGTELWLHPDPSNPYDSHAVEVILKAGNLSEAALAILAEKLPYDGFTIDQFLSWSQVMLGFLSRGAATPAITRSPIDLKGTYWLSARQTHCIQVQQVQAEIISLDAQPKVLTP